MAPDPLENVLQIDLEVVRAILRVSADGYLLKLQLLDIFLWIIRLAHVPLQVLFRDGDNTRIGQVVHISVPRQTVVLVDKHVQAVISETHDQCIVVEILVKVSSPAVIVKKRSAAWSCNWVPETRSTKT